MDMKKQKKGGVTLVKEISALGRKMEGVLTAAVQNKETKAVQAELSRSVRKVGQRITDALDAARKSEESRQLRLQAEKVFMVGKKEGAEAARKVRSNLVTGLRGLAKELSGLAGKIDKK
jgi:hypothetical protein